MRISYRMQHYLPILKNCFLFQGIKKEEISAILSCLSATIKSYQKGSFLYHSGDFITMVGIILTGTIHLVKEDYWGNQNILTQINQGQVFGEVYACLEHTALTLHVVAIENTSVLFLDIHKIITVCAASCKFHTLLIKNLFLELAQKNLILTRKINSISQRTTKDKLLSYLSEQALLFHSNTFEIPFTRQQLADYLSVDRSAMSKELCKLRDCSILKFHKNKFTLFSSFDQHS